MHSVSTRDGQKYIRSYLGYAVQVQVQIQVQIQVQVQVSAEKLA